MVEGGERARNLESWARRSRHKFVKKGIKLLNKRDGETWPKLLLPLATHEIQTIIHNLKTPLIRPRSLEIRQRITELELN